VGYTGCRDGRLGMISKIIFGVAMWLVAPSATQAGAQNPAQTQATPKASAPIDLTGYWTAVLTEDWHVRMFTAPKGDFGSGAPGALAVVSAGRLGVGANPAQDGNIPYNVKGAQAAMAWDAARDEAEGNQCKAYGAPGIMRQPTHLHITWPDENTLKVEADFGTQTRLLRFERPVQRQVEPTLQGYSSASWLTMGGGGGQAKFERGGALKVVTTNLKPGYYWKNGIPYTENAVLKENLFLLNLPDGTTWMTVTQMVEDPEYLTGPYVVNYHFKKLPDGSKWNPTPCLVR
jgi:hypothetical protein